MAFLDLPQVRPEEETPGLPRLEGVLNRAVPAAGALAGGAGLLATAPVSTPAIGAMAAAAGALPFLRGLQQFPETMQRARELSAQTAGQRQGQSLEELAGKGFELSGTVGGAGILAPRPKGALGAFGRVAPAELADIKMTSSNYMGMPSGTVSTRYNIGGRPLDVDIGMDLVDTLSPKSGMKATVNFNFDNMTQSNPEGKEFIPMEIRQGAMRQVKNELENFVKEARPQKVGYSAAREELVKPYELMTRRLARKFGGKVTESQGGNFEVTFDKFKEHTVKDFDRRMVEAEAQASGKTVEEVLARRPDIEVQRTEMTGRQRAIEAGNRQRIARLREAGVFERNPDALREVTGAENPIPIIERLETLEQARRLGGL